jgi:hypothetical protein
VETRPPALIETIVRLSIPAPCREHVVGDLWERYRSPGSFMLDAARTVPFVIASQIRRTTRGSALVIQAFLLAVGFAVGAGGLVTPIAPVAAALLGLVLRDAYKSCVSVSAGQVLRDLAVGAGFVVASQIGLALLRPSLLLPLPAAVSGAVAFGMVFLLRLQNPGLGTQPRRNLVQAPASLDALVTEVRMHESLTSRAIRIEMSAGVVLAVFFLFPMFSAQNWALRVGWALASAYGLYVAIVVSRHRPQPMPEGMGFNQSIRFYREVLEKQHGVVRTMWLWYVLPFAPSSAFVVIGSALVASDRGRPLWPAAIFIAILAGIGLLVHRNSQDMARKLRARIDTLASAEEQSR